MIRILNVLTMLTAYQILLTLNYLINWGLLFTPPNLLSSPGKRITFLGLILDSISIRVILSAERNSGIKQSCCEPLAKQIPIIRNVAKVISLVVPSFPGVTYGPLHYNSSEMDNTEGLRNMKSRASFLLHLFL